MGVAQQIIQTQKLLKLTISIKDAKIKIRAQKYSERNEKKSPNFVSI